MRNRLWHLPSPVYSCHVLGWPIHSCESGSYIQSLEDQVILAAGREFPERTLKSRKAYQNTIQVNVHVGICVYTPVYITKIYVYTLYTVSICVKIIRVFPIPFQPTCALYISKGNAAWRLMLSVEIGPHGCDASSLWLTGRGKYTQLIGSLQKKSTSDILFSHCFKNS